MSPQRRAALSSVVAAAGLVALKLVTGLATGSLGLISEAAHSATDLVAAVLTFFAVGVSGRPADTGHQYGHGKAEHLAALAEASFLGVVAVWVGVRAVERLTGHMHASVHAAWYAFAVLAVVLAIDVSRTVVSWRTARHYGSAALASNALHFASDFAGSLAVLAGLASTRAGYPGGDAVAALFVAVLVLAAAARLARRNVDVLMDIAPAAAEAAAREAIDRIEPGVDLRRLRMRHAGGRHFADVVIAVSPGAAVGQGHAAADRVAQAVQRVLPGSDVVVHVEPTAGEQAIRDRANAAALGVGGVREIHNLSVVTAQTGTALSLHLKLPGELTLEEAHEVASEVERAILEAVPEIGSVQTHLEPLAEPLAGRDVEADSSVIERIVRETTGTGPRELRFLRTDDGLVAFLTLGLDPTVPLSEAHSRASEIEERIRRESPEIAELIVHTEP
ncbi:MAG: cation diffusion facilitator family transporter [Gaiellaceae bacterium]